MTRDCVKMQQEHIFSQSTFPRKVLDDMLGAKVWYKRQNESQLFVCLITSMNCTLAVVVYS